MWYTVLPWYVLLLMMISWMAVFYAIGVMAEMSSVDSDSTPDFKCEALMARLVSMICFSLANFLGAFSLCHYFKLDLLPWIVVAIICGILESRVVRKFLKRRVAQPPKNQE